MVLRRVKGVGGVVGFCQKHHENSRTAFRAAELDILVLAFLPAVVTFASTRPDDRWAPVTVIGEPGTTFVGGTAPVPGASKPGNARAASVPFPGARAPAVARGDIWLNGRRVPILRPSQIKFCGSIEGYRRLREARREADTGIESRHRVAVSFALLQADDVGLFFVEPDWCQPFEIAQPVGNVPYGVTRIEGFSGATGEDPGLINGADVAHLIEAYDEHVVGVPGGGDLVAHRRYLGGVLINLGPVPGPGQQFVNWVVEAPPGSIFPFHTGNDDYVVLVHRMGLLDSQQRFVPEPSGDPSSLPRLTFVMALEDSGAQYDVGGCYPSWCDRLYIDGVGDYGYTDRVHWNYDRVWFLDNLVLFTRIDGVPMTDCNTNGLPDDFEVWCWTSGLAGAGACPGDACPYFNDVGTTGFQSPHFANPLEEHGHGATCIPAATDYNGNGVPDACDQPGDFDGDGDVDLDDFAPFADCLVGPGVVVPPGGCTQEEFEMADLDADNDVDLNDFAHFQLAFTG